MVKFGKIDCEPKEVGYHAGTLDNIDSHLIDLIKKEKIQGGGYIISRKGKILAHRTMGKLSGLDDRGDYQPDSIRLIASVSKMFTAISILQLMERGKLSLNQPVANFINEFDNDMYGGISILDLLTHTSGLKADTGAFFEPYAEEMDEKSLTKENWIKKHLTGVPHYKSGTTYSYCTTGYFMLAEIVARVSGMEYTDYVEENIFKPLGMVDSHYFLPEEKHSRAVITEEWQVKHLNNKKEDMKVSTSFFGGFGIYSTLKDLWKFGQMLLNNGTFNDHRILGRKTVEALSKKQIVDVPCFNWTSNRFTESYNMSYGYGVQVGKHNFQGDRVFGHEGYGGAMLLIDPDEDLVYVALHPDNAFCMESWHNTLQIVWAGID